MSLINLQDVSLSLGGLPLFDQINLQIEENERLCLVGRNGEGKSTLLRLLAGTLPPDSGQIIKRPGLKTAILAQEVPRALAGTVYDVVAKGLGNMLDLLARHHAVSTALTGTSNTALLAELEKTEHALEATGGWQAQQQISTVLTRLQLEADDNFSDLSGGMKRRVLLAQALVSEPDLLLLDEPTNHLDIDSILWLEEFLTATRRTILFITHDRLLARKLATRVIDLDRGKLTSWPGQFDQYLRLKEEHLAIEADHQKKFDKKLSQEEAWIRQGVKARRTRNQGRVTALLALRKERMARRETLGRVNMQLQEAEKSGKLLLQARHVSHSYDARKIIEDFSTTVLNGDKIGMIGPNGCGKTTLLRILLGILPPAEGEVKQGANLQIAYFDQLRAQLDEEQTVAFNVAQGNDTVLLNGRPKHIIGFLKDFLFTPERARSPVKTLSGGERNRLLLAKLFSNPANLLVLDEPTNDLDAETLELLEELLLDFPGTVLLVSHDRAFINNVVTSTIVFEGNGIIKEYAGGYDDWLMQRNLSSSADGKQDKPKKLKKAVEKPVVRKLNFNEKKELHNLPQRIETLELEQKNLYDTLADPAFYQENGGQTSEIQDRLRSLGETLEHLYARWEELEAIPEK